MSIGTPRDSESVISTEVRSISSSILVMEAVSMLSTLNFLWR